ncbi:MAG: hypothetical protein KF873_12220 [Gemmataceae bacterium]|nr:hypothetical protein [Gemmataceae bacterium]
MKDLLQHLWKNSRLFQVVVVGAIGAIAWSQFGRPSARTPPPPPDPNAQAKVGTPIGDLPIPGATEQDMKDIAKQGKGLAGNVVDAANTGAGAAKEVAGLIWDGAKFVRRQVDPPAPMKNPPLDPPSPKTP